MEKSKCGIRNNFLVIILGCILLSGCSVAQYFPQNTRNSRSKNFYVVDTMQISTPIMVIKNDVEYILNQDEIGNDFAKINFDTINVYLTGVGIIEDAGLSPYLGEIKKQKELFNYYFNKKINEDLDKYDYVKIYDKGG